MRRLLSLAGALAALSAAAILPARSDTPSDGWTLSSVPNPAPFAAFCTLPGGDLATFDGQSIDRWTAAGGFVMNLGTLPSATFASFVVPTPDGTAVVIGESSNGQLYVVQADGSGLAPLVQLTFNYDAEFLPGGDLLVSAALGGFGAGNDLVRVDLAPPSSTPIGHVDGPSGPVAISPAGDLYYATQDSNFPAGLGTTDVLFWPASQVQNGPALSNANATLTGAGFDGGSSLAFDPAGGKLYLGETNFGAGINRIREVAATQSASAIVVDASGYISSFEFLYGGYPASFAAYQPATGWNLRYGDGSSITTAAPVRPVLTVRGPGTSGAGQVKLEVAGGVPNGYFQVTACPQSALSPTEGPIQLPTFLLHTTFDLSVTRRVAALFPLDATGKGSFTFNNPGNLQGVYAYQFFVANTASTFVASSNVTQF